MLPTTKTTTVKHAHRLLNRASRRLQPQAVRFAPRVFCNPDMPSGWTANTDARGTAGEHDIIVPANPMRALLA